MDSYFRGKADSRDFRYLASSSIDPRSCMYLHTAGLLQGEDGSTLSICLDRLSISSQLISCNALYWPLVLKACAGNP